ncbi:hypothetical protein ACS8FA_01280 [Psychrobacter sp. 1Y1]|uniref:hypothetical protein n=1 Tax=Psychrobacter sp. 1Y1 TaxID=3453574 RepID=UPI003F45DADC
MSFFKGISSFFTSKTKRMTPSELFAQEKRIDLDTQYSSASVNGLAITEFNYLLKYYSKNEVKDFEDLELLLSKTEFILSNIEQELESGEFGESVLTVNAEYNAKNLKDIVEVLSEYQRLKSLE